ncbi:MAG: glycoside hydrolase family 9 protein [Bacteroidales bacterium]|nr:glycoside hydrolase family 9 protein [Bacteroidales bacterium]
MKKIIISLLVIAASLEVVAQTFTSDDYKKAGWMTLRFYGGQRISLKDHSAPNWLIMDHGAGYDFDKDADGNTDLTGGWFDCGDHVLFGQTFFYSAYVVLKGYDAFPEGYDDYYSYNYSGYQAAGDFSWEGKKGQPNGIPDVLDEVKAACEFMIKATPNGNTFYSQKGDGNADHKNWVTSVKMATLSRNDGGQSDGPRSVVKNPNDGSMPSFCAATLALMSRLYAQFDPDFAETCLQHAKYAYSYASGKKGACADAGSFYPANTNMYTAYICAAAELYWATNDNSYKQTALSNSGQLKDYNWAFGYNNNYDVAAYNLAMLGDSNGAEWLEFYVTNYYKGKTSNGIFQISDNWGTFRYLGNAAFVVALYNKYKGNTSIDTFVTDQVDFIMGKNAANMSCIVGFKPSSGSYTYFSQPHHRNVYLSDGNNNSNLSIPSRNTQFGFLGGGSGYNVNTLKNAKADEYTITEGGVDYQAALVGAFGYINSFLSPIDPNKFGHPTPDLGPELTLCGTGSATITATVDLSNLEQGEQVTYKWYKGSTLLSQHNGKTSITVTEAGTYTCELVETTGSDWTTSGKVVVSATLPDVAIGDDAELCKVTSATFSTDVAGDGITYTWYKDNKVISGATTNSYTAYSGGTYKLTISASGCASKSDEAVVTSQLPIVVGDTICSAGTATLSVTTSGEYSWYSVAEEGNALASGSTYSPNITKTTTYYVQDASSLNTTAGPSQSNLTNSRTYGTASVYFKLSSAVQITQMSVVYGSIYYGSQQALSVTVGGKTYTSAKQNVQNAGKYTFSFESNPIILSAGSYTMELKPDNAGFTYYTNLNYSGFQHSDIILFNNNNNNDYGFPGTYDWKIVAGSTCARTPVFAVLDPDNPNCAGDTEAPSVPGTITVSNITTNSASVSWGASTDNTAVTGYDVYVNGTKLQSVTTNSINLSDLSDNTEYTIKVRAYDEAGNLSEFNTEKSFTTLKSTVTQSISLSAGWNLISFYVLPEDASITNVFGSNISKVSIVKNNDGFYKPSKADKLQSLTEFEYGQAYLVKANSAFSISVEGVAPTSTTISLKAGWNLLGYPKTTEANASNVLSGIAGKYTELKDLSSSQTTLKPGKGYYIKMNSDASVTIGN